LPSKFATERQRAISLTTGRKVWKKGIGFAYKSVEGDIQGGLILSDIYELGGEEVLEREQGRHRGKMLQRVPWEHKIAP
jgi:hypothetical protein